MLDGVNKSAELRIGELSKMLVARLPNHVIDLIEIAALVYAIDSSVSRGGLSDHRIGGNLTFAAGANTRVALAELDIGGQTAWRHS